MSRLTTVLALAAFAILVAACGNAAAGPATPVPSAGPSAGPSTPRVVADRLVFTTPTVTVAAGVAFDLVFENRESPLHNVTIARDASFDDKLFEGDVVSSQTVTYEIPALEAGTYAFRCDVHPNMVGTLQAE